MQNGLFVLSAAALLTACRGSTGTGGNVTAGPGMSPLVEGFSEGQSIRFIHTEASDASVADMLTRMMGSPVLLVPELAEAPSSTLATVYVFTNDVSGPGLPALLYPLRRSALALPDIEPQCLASTRAWT